MNRFSIKDIERLTGVKSHTLRILEQRYGIPQPKRTATNIRYYDDADLRLLLNVAMLNKQGYKISKLTSMSTDELEKLALTESLETSDQQVQLDSLMAAMFDLDELGFERILSNHLLRHGLEFTMIELFFPFLKRIGVLWQTGQVNPAFEHFMSNLIRQKIIVAIDSLPHSTGSNLKKFILFLPENETHEIGLLFANYIIRSRGHKSLYLGQNLPYTDLNAVLKQYDADFVMTILTSVPLKQGIESMIDNLGLICKKQKVWVTGIQVTSAQGLKVPSNVEIIEDHDMFVRKIETLEK
jgi:MerR family transcriptional regulator, light-induced transcriptional regulator